MPVGNNLKNGEFPPPTLRLSMALPQEGGDGGLEWKTFGKRLARIRGRVMLFLDACHSGSIVTKTVVPNDELAWNFFKVGAGGVMVFSAAKGRQDSMESPDIGAGFGIITYALVQGLGPQSKEADRDGNGYIEFIELVGYVSRYVNRGTVQTPRLSRKELFADLALAAVD